MISKEFVQHLVDTQQDLGIEHLTKVVRALWHDVARLHRHVSASDQGVTITSGEASVVLKKDGTIVIRGKDIVIEGAANVTVKARGNLVLKGARIVEN